MKRKGNIEYALQNLVSPKRGHTLWGLIATLLVAAAFIWIQHSKWISDPNRFMLGSSADGLKNYMASVWHIQRDSDYVHYSGMNYPKGEHVLFTDNQPIFCSAIIWWSRHVSDVRANAVGIINSLQWISLLLACGVLFVLLRKLHLPVWYAGLAALAILFLSPQYQRFDEHFALSHAWVLPMLLLLLCRYEERFSRRYQSLSIGILLVVASQIHFYYFGLAALFLGFYTFYHLVLDPSWGNIRRRMSHLVVMLILPFVFINIWLHWSDFSIDRPANPYGFTTYMGHWEGIFLPYEYFSLHKFIDQHIIPIRKIEFESKAYVGLAAFFFFLWMVALWMRKYWGAIKSIFRKKDSNPIESPRLFPKDWNDAAYHRVHRRYLYGILMSSLFLVFFACGIPYAIPGLEWTLDLMGPLKQFRGLGRFTWAFYYIINIVMFYTIWNAAMRFKGIKNGKYTSLKWLFVALPLLVMGAEAWVYQRHEKPHAGSNETLKEVSAASPDHWVNKVDFKKYQALLPLPYYHIGSENVWLEFEGFFFQRVQTTAVLTGVPDMGVNMSRTSIGQMLRSTQLLYEPCENPAILDDLPDNRPLALMILPDKFEEMKANHPHLLEKAHPAYESTRMKVMTLHPDSIKSWRRARVEQIKNEGIQNGNTTNPKVIALHYDDQPETLHPFQKGGFTANMGDSTHLVSYQPNGKEVRLSFWIYAHDDLALTHELITTEYQNKVVLSRKSVALRHHIKSIVRDWALIEVVMMPTLPDTELGFHLHKKGVNKPFLMDELLIRPTEVNYYWNQGKFIVKNNYWYEL